MKLEDYIKMQEAKGTPKVWVVESGFFHNIYTDLFQTEEEAKASFDKIPTGWYRKMYQTWDIWGWTERQKRKT